MRAVTEWIKVTNQSELERLAAWLDRDGYRMDDFSKKENISAWARHPSVVKNLDYYGGLIIHFSDTKVLGGYDSADRYDHHDWITVAAKTGKGGANSMARRMFAQPNQVKTSFRRR